MLLMVWAALLISAAWCNAQETRKVYFGLMHAHTSFSDGEGTPDDAYTMAKEASLDFFAITEHNHNQAVGNDDIFLTETLYDELQESAARHTVDGEFLAIWGQEVSTISKGNHENIFFASDITDMCMALITSARRLDNIAILDSN
jgi:histidinol phosphatase-like PHP family hydrolase